MGGGKWTSVHHAFFRTRLNLTPLLKPTWTCCPSWSGQPSPSQSSAWTSSRMTRKRSKLPVAHSGSVLVPEALQAGSPTLMGFRACSSFSLNGCLLSGCLLSSYRSVELCAISHDSKHRSVSLWYYCWAAINKGSIAHELYDVMLTEYKMQCLKHHISFISGTTDKVSVHRFGGSNFVFLTSLMYLHDKLQ